MQRLIANIIITLGLMMTFTGADSYIRNGIDLHTAATAFLPGAVFTLIGFLMLWWTPGRFL